MRKLACTPRRVGVAAAALISPLRPARRLVVYVSTLAGALVEYRRAAGMEGVCVCEAVCLCIVCVCVCVFVCHVFILFMHQCMCVRATVCVGAAAGLNVDGVCVLSVRMRR